MKSKQKSYKWSKGQINPRLAERQDLAVLDSSAQTITNYISTPYGSIKTRPGTENIANVGTTGDSAILTDFVYDTENKYVLVITDEQIEIYESDSLIQTVTATDLLDTLFDRLKYSQSEDLMVFAHPDLKTSQLKRTDVLVSETFVAALVVPGPDYITTGWSLPSDVTGYPVKVSSTGALPAGLTEGVLYFTVNETSLGPPTEWSHTKLALVAGGTPVTISDYGTGTHTIEYQNVSTGITFEYGDFEYINVPKHDFVDTTETSISQTLTPNATEGTVTLTLGGGTWVGVGASVGQIIDGGGGRVRITEIDPSTATIAYGYTIIPFYTTDAIASGDWNLITGYEDVWSVARGYPSTVMLYEQRVWFGGSKSRPNTIWASRIGFLYDFENIGNYDNDAINQTISSSQQDEIVNIYANRGIQVFTAGAEWAVPAGSTTPSTFSISKTTSNGSLSTVPVVDISGTTLFVEKNGKSLLGYVYQEGQNAQVTSSMSLLTDLVNNPVDMAVDYNSSQDVGNFLYMPMTDGTMAIFCIVLDQQINSPVKYICASDGLVKSVVNVSGDTYLLVDRTNGVMLEKVTDDVVDLMTTSTPSGADLSGLTDYEGEDIRVYDSTTDYGTYTVSSGAVTLSSSPAGDVTLGIEYDYNMESNKVAINGQTENIETRIAKATVVTRNTAKLTFEGQEIEQTDDVYDLYGVTGFERDNTFTMSGSSYDSAEILSVLLNINYGEK